ncbi:MAG: hypothetical protein ABSB81_03020 [Halobacteriota archaeon]|jgi:hypothetical protein
MDEYARTLGTIRLTKTEIFNILVKPLICNAQLSVRYSEVLTVAFEEIIAAEKRDEIRNPNR